MNSESPTPDISLFVLAAFFFEAGLGAAAVAAGWFVGFDPLATLPTGSQAISANAWAAWWGTAAAIPLMLGLLVIQRLRFGPFRRLTDVVESKLLHLFTPLSVFELAAISIAAGFGEEVLFRGLVQAGLTDWIGPPYGMFWALGLSAVVFGVCHWITPTYAVLASLVGVYLGTVFLLTGNILAPLIAHALYDFAALVYLTRFPQRTQKSSPPDEL